MDSTCLMLSVAIQGPFPILKALVLRRASLLALGLCFPKSLHEKEKRKIWLKEYSKESNHFFLWRGTGPVWVALGLFLVSPFFTNRFPVLPDPEPSILPKSGKEK